MLHRLVEPGQCCWQPGRNDIAYCTTIHQGNTDIPVEDTANIVDELFPDRQIKAKRRLMKHVKGR